jgi:SAM-dependent methyltransferase
MRDRWRGGVPEDRWAGRVAEEARLDPRRPPDANLQALLAYLEPEDVVLDVGGGAGRISLPLALRCREVISVEPSPAMRAQFERAAEAAGITNARVVPAAWPMSDMELTADVVLTTHVTYFVADIVPFVQALERAARRRVIIDIWSVPPPMLGSAVYELLFGGPVEPPPGQRELLPVLWDMGLLPEVRVLPLPMRQNYAWVPQPTREQMVERAVRVAGWQGPVDPERARGLIESRFPRLFVRGERGYRPVWPDTVRELLITWEPRRNPSA